jgi:hypothetical protein
MLQDAAIQLVNTPLRVTLRDFFCFLENVSLPLKINLLFALLALRCLSSLACRVFRYVPLCSNAP